MDMEILFNLACNSDYYAALRVTKGMNEGWINAEALAKAWGTLGPFYRDRLERFASTPVEQWATLQVERYTGGLTLPRLSRAKEALNRGLWHLMSELRHQKAIQKANTPPNPLRCPHCDQEIQVVLR